MSAKDAMLVFSVGGGSREHNISMNLVQAMELATEVGAPIYAFIGKADGHAAQAAEVAIVVACDAARRTPHVESFQAICGILPPPTRPCRGAAVSGKRSRRGLAVRPPEAYDDLTMTVRRARLLAVGSAIRGQGADRLLRAVGDAAYAWSGSLIALRRGLRRPHPLSRPGTSVRMMTTGSSTGFLSGELSHLRAVR